MKEVWMVFVGISFIFLVYEAILPPPRGRVNIKVTMISRCV